MTKPEMKEQTYKVTFGDRVQADLHVTERGEGQPFLLLHGGAGPISVTRFADLFAKRHPARVITPTHPGFALTPRPDGLKDVKGLAQLYAAFLDQLNANDVTVVGNSIGGWIACELALLTPPQVRRVVLVDAGGIEVPNHPVTDISKLSPDQLMGLSYHNPKPFLINPATLTDVQKAAIGSNRAALSVYAGPLGIDPTLAARLPKIAVPALVLWGDSDRIVDQEYSRAFASAIPGAKFLILKDTGHVPQIETPGLLIETLWNFAREGT